LGNEIPKPLSLDTLVKFFCNFYEEISLNNTSPYHFLKIN